MSETFRSLGIDLTLKDKNPALKAEIKYHTYVRTEVAAIGSMAVAVSGPAPMSNTHTQSLSRPHHRQPHLTHLRTYLP